MSLSSSASRGRLFLACAGAAVFLVIFIAAAPRAQASVWTDQSDYSPGSTVTISGDNSDNAGYLPAETVNVSVAGPNGYTSSCSGTADSSGAWSCQITLASDSSAIGDYSYTATGQSSGTTQSGLFTDAASCPPSGTGSPPTDPNVGAAFTVSGNTATYTLSTVNGPSVSGVPGLIDYCVFPTPSTPLPDSHTVLATGQDGTPFVYDTGGNNFAFTRGGGNPSNLPFDGHTHTLGTATWSGGLPTSQTILLHVNDPSVCHPFNGSDTCFVLPGLPTAKDLTVTKTATPSFTRTYTWGITKSVDKTTQDIATGGSATFNYIVNVTHDSGTDSNWQVNGKITLTNPNTFDISGANVSDAINNGGSCSVTNGTNVTVPASSSKDLSYTCTYASAPSPSSGTDTATATWNQATYNTPHGSASGNATSDFGSANPTIKDGSVTVSDTFGGNLGTASYTDQNPKTFSYAHTFSGDPGGTCTTHTNTATFTTSDTNTTGSASQQVKVCVGANLTVTKAASAAFTRTYKWGISKAADKQEIDVANGGSATFNYAVTVTHDGGTDSAWQVTGTITVTNPNDWEAVTFNLSDAIDNGGTCSVAGGGSGLSVAAGKTVTANYTCTYASAPSPSSGTNTATATWDSTKYFTPSGSGSGTAGVDFSQVQPAIVDGSVSVSDPLDPQSPRTFSYTAPSPQTYTYAATYSGDKGGTCTTHQNTATLTTSDTGTTGSASQTVKVCVGEDLTVTKAASGAFNRTYKWGISKAADKQEIDVANGGSATFNYAVTVTHDGGTDGGWQVTGAITVTNPNDWEAVTFNLSDAINNGGTCSVAGGGSGLSVAAGKTVTANYTCTYASAPSPSSGTNTATATWDSTKYSTPSGSASGTAGVDFSQVNPTIVDGSVSVTDPLDPQSPRTFSYTGQSPQTFSYLKTYSGDPGGTCTTHTNTATFTTSDTSTTGSATQKVKVCVAKDLTVTKAASAAFNRTYKWGISKGVDSAVVSQGSGSSHTFNYTVTVTHDSGTDGGWNVTGTIKVTNPNNWEPITYNLSDAINNGGTCSIAGGGSGLTVAAGQTLPVSYTCTYSSAPSPSAGTNTATATWDSTKYFTPTGSASGTAGVDFSQVNPAIIDGSVSVSDPIDPLSPHTVAYTDASPKTFTYSRTVAVPSAGCQSYNNTATFTTNTTKTTGSASKSVTICRTGAFTDSQLCTFDVDTSAPNSQMHLIYTPDQTNLSVWKLNASNPGQFYYNVIYAGAGNTTVNITLPYPWVTQGAVPIHVYDGVSATTSNGQTCLTPGNALANSSTQVALNSYTSQTFGSTTMVSVNVPSLPNGIAYINIHLDYGLKGTTGYTQGSMPGSCNSNTYDALNTTTGQTITDCLVYAFSDSLGGSATVQNENVFKKDPGIGGLLASSVGDPRVNVPVKIYSGSSPTGAPLGSVSSDQDGWYMWQYKYTGKAATFTVNLPTYNSSQTVTLKSNGFLVVSWNTLP